ncbi:uncharacterized protein LOC131884073 isoform X2 [Tigriopus californicus]|uniref:uncharacterized protein LOC131884073 isoform X2 n=1 Tax=Tigriopus californicus TaxID=6832 RepID=UPI0027DA8977|nr:uncharacterized protein LOC131884073 isoform X2 [Tigriopus californicus]
MIALKALIRIVSFLHFLSSGTLSVESAKELGQRNPRFLSLFQVVQFPNDSCNGSNGKNGTCYTSAECESRVGTSSGSCASGYGICCTFTARCGATRSENCTYFESNGGEVGSCSVNICPCSDNICQLRLDFNSFVITGPSTSTVSTSKTLNGQQVGSTVGVASTQATQCLTDSFSVTNPNGVSPSVICGTNTGEHLYVDAHPKCNQLTFQLSTLTGQITASRSWSIKITQLSCDFVNLAPDGCDQYFFGSTTGVVRTFNYNGGSGYHLANQDQNICVRQERTTCRICWSATNDIDFMLSGGAAGGVTSVACCGYGSKGTKTAGFDCVMIPSASKMAVSKVILPAAAFCGRSKGLVSVGGGNSATVCSRKTPFNLRFLSDGFEFVNEAAITDRGFQLNYILSGTNC